MKTLVVATAILWTSFSQAQTNCQEAALGFMVRHLSIRLPDARIGVIQNPNEGTVGIVVEDFGQINQLDLSRVADFQGHRAFYFEDERHSFEVRILPSQDCKLVSIKDVSDVYRD